MRQPLCGGLALVPKLHGQKYHEKSQTADHLQCQADTLIRRSSSSERLTCGGGVWDVGPREKPSTHRVSLRLLRR